MVRWPFALMLVTLVTLVMLVPRLAAAHQTSVKYVTISLDGNVAAVEVRVAPGDLTEPMQLPADATPTVATAVARAADVAPYVARWLLVTAANAPCTPAPPTARADEGGKLVVIAWRATCAAPPDTLDLTAFFALDRKHAAIVHVAATSADAFDTTVAASQPALALRRSPSLAAWVVAGMHHIYDGRDHVSFVIALLLVVMLYRGTRPGEWLLLSPRQSLRATAIVITAFTLAHSISLIAASLGWVQLPSRLVESLIALSIAYTAVENIARPDVRWRYALTFGFGLVHGLGFASTLAQLLPPRDVIVPLLCFNVGVEVGQLTIVAVALPALYAVARLLGAARYRSTAMPILSSVIVVLGLNWLIARTLGVSLLPWFGT